ncbi:complex I subunit 5 family protein [Ramlibacter rhizophilus]|uniref:NADH:quinone oxidoreductase/Mrp antiporter transmembrane domain-containing protein n=1 Tax=Ramlibacter rhizophilus TaxID=1781167 RepID=A0A4Z0C059_9BURK|nr:proton-conducting transporter membrane subunit [Ramlibacter rhizophilus]TFZ04194.1 hypothetical protein EZ242_00030 [Ramlibacter rhizophilus]
MSEWLAAAASPQVPWSAMAVALPLAAALAASVSLRLAQALVLPVSLLAIAVGLGAVLQAASHDATVLAVGGWRPPLGIALRNDGLAAAFTLVGALVAAAALGFARGPMREGPQRRAWAFWPLCFGLVAALNAAFFAADLFNLYVALELLTICGVSLVALEGTRAALESALRYLLFALLGSLSFLLGVVMLYAGFGSLDLGELRRLGATQPPAPAAIALVAAGLMAKSALFPLHGWLAPAHAAAPAPASALLSALVVKAPVLVLLRLGFEVFPALTGPALGQLLGALGALAIVLGSLLAWRQQRLKLVVAYSTVAQLGYLLLLFPLATGAARAEDWAATAWVGVALHALAHALAKAALFLSAGAMAEAVGNDRIDSLAGLGSAMPLAAFAFALAAVSLMGLPPSAGFLAKYLLLVAALASGQWWWAAVMLVGGLLAAGYLFRPMARLLADAQPVLQRDVSRARQTLALALALAAVLLGLGSAWPYRMLAAPLEMAP